MLNQLITVIKMPAIRISILLILSFGVASAYQTEEEFISFIPLVGTGSHFSVSEDWSMAAANPQRTSWSPEQVTDNLSVLWYRPIEAYLPQNSQVIAASGLLYISTARGLYALNPMNGNVAWRYDTELPLGNSPTVDGGVVYFGGYDRKLHALDALTGSHLWAFSDAEAGFDTNPLVIDGKVIAGNRDGNMYAVGAHGTSDQGQMIWKYQTGGPIHLSAAYKDGIVYFASNDNYAYALDSDSGSLVWRSEKLPGFQFQSYWPVIYKDLVIIPISQGYRWEQAPGTRSGDGISFRTDIYSGGPEGTVLGQEVSGQDWSHGYPIIEVSSLTQYLEDNPPTDPYNHKPWRRSFAVLNRFDGSEYTYDSDQDGYQEYFPASWHGAPTGNRYPPLVGPDDILYFTK
jgi:outer membrane protein assembly factor BamB